MAPPKKYRRDAVIIAAYQRGDTPEAIAARQSPLISRERVMQILRDAKVTIVRRRGGLGRAPIPVVAPDGTVMGESLAEAATVIGCTYQALRIAGNVRDGVLYLKRMTTKARP
jgi:hypothetical protein